MKKYTRPTIEKMEISLINNIANSLSGSLNNGNEYGNNATEDINYNEWKDLF